MESSPKELCIAGLVLLLAVTGSNAAEKCPGSTPDKEAMKLSPCSPAAQDPKVTVLKFCCIEIEKIMQNPACLCAAMLSNSAKAGGVIPKIAVTIPKRCNLTKRPIGYKCGGYTIP